MTQNLYKNNFEKWATGFSGCDGGDIGSPDNASIWYCGIEWGGGHTAEVATLSEMFNKDVSEPALGYTIEDNPIPWRENLAYIFNWQAMKLLAAVNSLNVSEYKKFAEDIQPFVRGNKGYYKMNLYPLAFKNTSYDHWQAAFAEVTDCYTKSDYLTWVRNNRFPVIRSWVARYKPKAVICSGITYADDFRSAFLDEDSSLDEEIIEGKKLRWSKNKDGVIVFITPFLVNRYGLNRNITIQKFGDRIKELLDVPI